MNNKISKNINRCRNIIWFNPPFCKLSNINIGKYFLGLINKHFKDDNLDNIIYQANLSTKENDTNDKSYIGMTSLN